MEMPGLWRDVPQVVNDLARDVIGAAILVHEELGPGMLEEPYKLVLAKRLEHAGHKVDVERAIALTTAEVYVPRAYVADIIVDDALLLEIKSVQQISFPMILQTKTYLRLTGLPLGLILNFNAPKLWLGIRRVVP